MPYRIKVTHASVTLCTVFVSKSIIRTYSNTVVTGTVSMTYVHRPSPRCFAQNAFKLWHVAYHGTLASNIEQILNVGDLLMPGMYWV